MMKIQAVVIVNAVAETDAEKAIDKSESEKQMCDNMPYVTA